MKKTIAIIGGGTAGMMLAAFLNTDLYEIAIYEQKGSLGRKFLVAGDGGFNLTHSEPMESFKKRYQPISFLDKALEQFTNTDFRAWLNAIGIPTFVGSSKRVFPVKGMKPITVLKTIEDLLVKKGVDFHFNKTFIGWKNDNTLSFADGQEVCSDIVVFALGGGSWKVTGSDGHWLSTFADAGVDTKPFVGTNCAFEVDWSNDIIRDFAGTPFKNIAIHHGDSCQTGEFVLTNFGLEGNAIYGLSQQIQSALAKYGTSQIYIDFKPMFSISELIHKLNKSKYNTTKTLHDKIKLNPAQIALIKTTLSKEEYLNNETLANSISRFPLIITGSAPIDEAISTIGGISLSAINEYYELVNTHNNYCIGEMLDWNAPTGGYLIQGCASMGVNLAKILNKQRGTK